MSDLTDRGPVPVSLAAAPREPVERLIEMRAPVFWAGRLQLALSDVLEDVAFAAKSSLLWMAALVTGVSRLYAKPLPRVPAPDTSSSELHVGFKATQ